MLYRGKFNSPQVAMRSLQHDVTSAAGTHSSARHCGAKLCKHQQTKLVQRNCWCHQKRSVNGMKTSDSCSILNKTQFRNYR